MKKLVITRETISGKDPGEKLGMPEKLKSRATKAKKESYTRKSGEVNKDHSLSLEKRKAF